MGAVVSADGYVADMGGGVGPPFDRYSNGDEESEDRTRAIVRLEGRRGKHVLPRHDTGHENPITDNLEVVRRRKQRPTKPTRKE